MAMRRTWHCCLILMCVGLSTAKHNVIFILTDDQDVALGSMTPMVMTKQLIGDKGVTFENAFVTTPICCPSRSTILTGLYLSSHGVRNNFLNEGCSNVTWQEQMEPITYGAVLHNAGYRTFYAGKYLNEYGFAHSGGTQYVPPGWDWWIGLVGNSVYYNYTISVNGTAVVKGDKPEDYLTDVVKKYALDFLNQKHIVEGDEGFLMAINPPSAHDPYTPAPRHIGKFTDVKAPRTPTFNVPSNGTKHWITRLKPDVLPQETIDNIDQAYRRRWETLLAVDELVAELVQELERLSLLDDTYVMFASDHGFHFGQYGLTLDKRHPYETDIRVPMLLRGPGIPANKTVSSPVLSIDIAPTIMHMADVSPPNFTDGNSFLSWLSQGEDGPDFRPFLVEYNGEYNGTTTNCYTDTDLAWCYPDMSCKCFDMRNNTYTCIRYATSSDFNELYCLFDDEEEFVEHYDIVADPYEVHNLFLDPEAKPRLPYNEMLECARKNIMLKIPVSECFRFVT